MYRLLGLLYCKKDLYMDGESHASFISGKTYKVVSNSFKITKNTILIDEDGTPHDLAEWHIYFQIEPLDEIEKIMYKIGYEN